MEASGFDINELYFGLKITARMVINHEIKSAYSCRKIMITDSIFKAEALFVHMTKSNSVNHRTLL